MTYITLPSSPLPQKAVPRPLDFGSWQDPIAAGSPTRLDRLGNRFAIDVTMPRMKYASVARLWISALIQAIGQNVMLVTFPQIDFDVGNPGAPQINGAGQGGSTIQIDGCTAGYVFKEGQFFTVEDGKFSLYMVTADTEMGSGAAGVPVYPMMRRAPVDNSPIHINPPLIFGKLTGNLAGWTLERAGVTGLQFTIEEV